MDAVLSASGAVGGTVSFLQFFGSALQVTPHVHSLVPDGVFVPGEDGVRFEALPPPTQAEVERLLRLGRHVPRGAAQPLLPHGAQPACHPPAALLGTSSPARRPQQGSYPSDTSSTSRRCEWSGFQRDL
ncbi:transposase [Myxococcus sp. 1LA]